MYFPPREMDEEAGKRVLLRESRDGKYFAMAYLFRNNDAEFCGSSTFFAQKFREEALFCGRRRERSSLGVRRSYLLLLISEPDAGPALRKRERLRSLVYGRMR